MPDDRDWLEALYDEGADEEPPAELDSVILAAAREEVQAERRRRTKLLATAATVVLAAGVVYLLPDQAWQVGAPAMEEAAPARPAPPEPSAPAEPAESTVRAERARSESAPAVQSPGRLGAPASPPLDELTQRKVAAAEAVADSAAVSDRHPAYEEADFEARTERCGPPPGQPTERHWQVDPQGVLLIVESGEHSLRYRCTAQGWSAEPQTSEKQQPDPDHDQ